MTMKLRLRNKVLVGGAMAAVFSGFTAAGVWDMLDMTPREQPLPVAATATAAAASNQVSTSPRASWIVLFLSAVPR